MKADPWQRHQQSSSSGFISRELRCSHNYYASHCLCCCPKCKGNTRNGSQSFVTFDKRTSVLDSPHQFVDGVPCLGWEVFAWRHGRQPDQAWQSPEVVCGLRSGCWSAGHEISLLSRGVSAGRGEDSSHHTATRAQSSPELGTGHMWRDVTTTLRTPHSSWWHYGNVTNVTCNDVRPHVVTRCRASVQHQACVSVVSL